jgi:hypothetical protein
MIRDPANSAPIVSIISGQFARCHTVSRTRRSSYSLPPAGKIHRYTHAGAERGQRHHCLEQRSENLSRWFGRSGSRGRIVAVAERNSGTRFPFDKAILLALQNTGVLERSWPIWGQVFIGRDRSKAGANLVVTPPGYNKGHQSTNLLT